MYNITVLLITITMSDLINFQMEFYGSCLWLILKSFAVLVTVHESV